MEKVMSQTAIPVVPGSSRRPGLHASGRATHQPLRDRDWSGLNAPDILARYRPGRADPMQVLEVLLKLFNQQHTARLKTVSHKTRQERANFLRRFFRDLHEGAGFKTLPDPRSIGERHIRAMVQVWRQDKLKPATIQTYLSFLRGLAKWLGKNGFVRGPGYYGLDVEEYQRHEAAERDKSWSAQGIVIDALIEKVCAYTLHHCVVVSAAATDVEGRLSTLGRSLPSAQPSCWPHASISRGGSVGTLAGAMNQSSRQCSWDQFSTVRPATREKWRALLVTSTAPVAMACPAIIASMLPICVPALCNSAAMDAKCVAAASSQGRH
jgi:hypothetical protein